MSAVTGSGRRQVIDPLVSFAFVVSMDGEGGALEVARFNGVDGLSYEVEMIEYRDSANPNLPMFRQGRRKPGRITLKRGALVEGAQPNDLLNWIRQVEKGTIKTRDITITIGQYNGCIEHDQKEASWHLVGCYPTKWSLSALDGSSNSAVIESLEIVYSTMSRGDAVEGA